MNQCRIPWKPISFLFGLIASTLTAVGEDSAGSALLGEAVKQVSTYHAGQSDSHRMLRVVYFVPADRDPLPDHAARLDRILNDVSDFYQQGFRRFGVDSRGLPLEKKDEKLLLHLVKGKLPAASYNYESGIVTANEIRDALKGTVDMEHEHVLILYALCSKEADGRYVFTAPYYGGAPSSNEFGICHAADCELLDPLLLTAKDRQIVYTEHYYPRVQQTVAKFNSWYLGGIAHELGHGLGLPHDNGSMDEKGFGVSLMGGGNLHYRENLWGGDSPAFFSKASALKLLSHPLLTRSDRGRGEKVGICFDSLTFADENGVLNIEGKVGGSIPAYGVIAYTWPKSARSDHSAITYPVVLKNGAFKLQLTGLGKQPYHLKLSSLHVNGAEATETFQLESDAKGKLNIADLTAEWLVDRAESALLMKDPKAIETVSDAIIASAPTPESARKLRVLRSLLDPPAPADLASITGDHAYLSDVAWLDAAVGWGKPARNSFWFGENFQMSALLVLNGRFYDKGLYAHSPSRYGFTVDQKWKTLTATIGLRDGANPSGSAVFIVRGDGKELYRSKVLHVGASQVVSVDISAVTNLELITEGGNGNSNNSWAVWVDPEVRR